MFELETTAAAWADGAAHLGLGGVQVRFGRRHGRLLDGNLDLVRLLVEPDENVPLFHPIVVIHQDFMHLAGNAGGDEGHVAVDVSVVGRNCDQCCSYHRDHRVSSIRQPAQHGDEEQSLSPRVRRLRGSGAFRRCAGSFAGDQHLLLRRMLRRVRCRPLLEAGGAPLVCSERGSTESAMFGPFHSFADDGP